MKNNLVTWLHNSPTAATLVIANKNKSKIIIRAKMETLLGQISNKNGNSGEWILSKKNKFLSEIIRLSENYLEIKRLS